MDLFNGEFDEFNEWAGAGQLPANYSNSANFSTQRPRREEE
jgi:hypothetical protein